jgi:hypothetical protein
VSQLRTRIEMAFGLLTTKWRILKSPLQIKVKHIGLLFISITCIHNYCINNREGTQNYSYTNNNINNNNNNNNKNNTTNNNMNTTNNSTDNTTNNCLQYLPSDATVTTIVGHSMLRQIIVEQIIQLGLSRPKHNTNRNRNRNNN